MTYQSIFELLTFETNFIRDVFLIFLFCKAVLNDRWDIRLANSGCLNNEYENLPTRILILSIKFEQIIDMTH